MLGKVIKSSGKNYLVELENLELINANIQGKFRLEDIKTTNPLAAGDVVIVKQNQKQDYSIESILPRKNYLVRKSTNLSKQMQILAANIDHIYILATLRHPVTHLNFINRILVAAESYRINASILFNKIDLYHEKDFLKAEKLMKTYQEIGYSCHLISTKQRNTIKFLIQEIMDKQFMMVGNSRVGKSSLVNAIDHNLNLKIGDLSTSHEQGKHTTTFAEMHKISTGGYLIDTPGIRAFGLFDLNKEHLSHYFPEMRREMDRCRYNNCTHIEEPECAIKKNILEGKIAESRYETYLQLMTDDQGPYRRNDYK